MITSINDKKKHTIKKYKLKYLYEINSIANLIS